jgi:hypothetical protein
VGLNGEMIPCTHRVKDCLYGKTGLLATKRARSIGGQFYEIIPVEERTCVS